MADKKNKNIHDVIDSSTKIANILVVMGGVIFGGFLFFRYEMLQRELTLQTLINQRTLSDIKIIKSRLSRVETWTETTTDEILLGSTPNRITHQIRVSSGVKNTSDQQLTIDMHRTEFYLGAIDSAALSDGKITQVHRPGYLIDDELASNPVSWTLQYSEDVRLDETINIEEAGFETQAEVLTTNGWGTGQIDPNEATAGGAIYLVSDDEPVYFAYIVTFVLSDSSGETWQEEVADIVLLTADQER